MEILDRITVNPLQMGGQPCVRGLRVTVAQVIRQLAAGHSRERILAAYPYLEAEDLDACLRYASLRVEEQEVEIQQA
jgi:uncharacterized protein (DUF433 family)